MDYLKLQNMKKVNIADLVGVPELKNYYTPQPIEDLVNSINSEGQKSKVTVTPKLEIIDGYRIVDALSQLSKHEVDIEIIETEDLLKERIARNTYRIKTEEDQVEEVRTIFKSYPKSQGKKEEGISRAQKRVQALNHKWQDEDTINKVEFIMENDFENKVLSKAVVMKNQSVESCYEFLSKNKKIDEEMNYGYTKLVKEGTLSTKEANKFVTQRLDLETNQTTFVIPDKCYSYNTSCVEIEKLTEFHNQVQLIFTSVYYWQQRFYEVGEIPQPGHEPTKEEYLDNLTKLFIPVCKTLKETGVVAINIADSFLNGIPQRIPYLFIDYMEKNTPLKFIGEIIWSKKNPRGNGASEDKIRPKNKIEYIMTFALNPDKVYYKKLKYKKRDSLPTISYGYKDVSKCGKQSPKRKSLSTGYQSIKNHILEQEVENIITTSVGKNHDVYKIINDPHPAIMSPMLAISIILMFSSEDSIVYDCMAGSNVVGRCAQLLGRKSLSTELSSKYFKVGCRLLQNSVIEFNREDLDVINELAYEDDKIVYDFKGIDFQTIEIDKYTDNISSELTSNKNKIFTFYNKIYWPEDEEKEIKINIDDIEKVKIGNESYIFNADNIDVLRLMQENCIDSCVTDPPYGISFMNKKWDYDVPTVEFWKEVLRVLKPGGHLLSFAGAKTYHRMATRIEDAGFEIRDQMMWIYGQGFPKGKTNLKPSHEPIVVARKTFKGSCKENQRLWGTGFLNIDDCRIEIQECDKMDIRRYENYHETFNSYEEGESAKGKKYIINKPHTNGRWPGNIMFDHSPKEKWSKYFYCPKVSMKERNEGIEEFDSKNVEGRDEGQENKNVPFKNRTSLNKNIHPTVKPIELMQYLVRLVTPKNGILLEPFLGSGSTTIACIKEKIKFLGIEQSKEYFNIAVARTEYEHSKLNSLNQVTFNLN